MKKKTALIAAVIASALIPAAAQAQYYGQPIYVQPAPLYPYAVQPQPQANGYVIQQQVAPRAYPYVRNNMREDEAVNADFRRHASRTNHALVGELRKRIRAKQESKQEVINTTKVVREAPIVIEKKRYVDDPPRVIERRHYVDDNQPAQPRRKRGVVEQADEASVEPIIRPGEKTRVIRAEAEVTILGPDRMSIRLFRKGQGNNANARAE